MSKKNDVKAQIVPTRGAHPGNNDKTGSPDPAAFAERPRRCEGDRHEFLAIASVFGVSAARADCMLCLAAPTTARADDFNDKLKLEEPDITIILGVMVMSAYPSLIVHRNREKDGKDLFKHPIGTGPFELVSHRVGSKAVVKRGPNGNWWEGEAHLDDRALFAGNYDPSFPIALCR
jgi:ABC-type transport system substrate-binding protein